MQGKMQSLSTYTDGNAIRYTYVQFSTQSNSTSTSIADTKAHDPHAAVELTQIFQEKECSSCDQPSNALPSGAMRYVLFEHVQHFAAAAAAAVTLRSPARTSASCHALHCLLHVSFSRVGSLCLHLATCLNLLGFHILDGLIHPRHIIRLFTLLQCITSLVL